MASQSAAEDSGLAREHFLLRDMMEFARHGSGPLGAAMEAARAAAG
jgi:hypothetical protein